MLSAAYGSMQPEGVIVQSLCPLLRSRDIPRPGFRVWVTTRNEEGRKIALRLGADAVFATNEELPRRVDAVVDNVGAVTWAHSLRSLKRGGTLVVNGITTGGVAETDLLRIFVEQINIRGTIM